MQTSNEPLEQKSPVICPCTGLTEKDLSGAIRQCGGVLDTLRRSTGIATHCTGCLPALVEYLDDWHQKGSVDPITTKKAFGLRAFFKRAYDFLIKIRRCFLIRRYAIFVINTPIVKTRVALTYLVPDDSPKPIFPLFVIAQVYDRSGKVLRRTWSLLPYPRTKIYEVSAPTGKNAPPFYGLMKFWLWGTPITGSTRPYAYWTTSDAISSTHDKFSYWKQDTWKHTLVFIEITPSYDTDLVLCNPHSRPFSSAVSLVTDDGASLELGTVEVPALGTNLVCPLAMKPESASFLRGRRGSLILENADHPIMSYYLGHDLKRNRILIQHV